MVLKAQRAMLLAGVACLTMSAPALAQTSGDATLPGDAADQPADDAATASAAGDVADVTSPAVDDPAIVVTGSRIQTGNRSPTPVTILKTQALEAISPATIADGLNKLPQFVGSNSQSTNGNPSSNAVGNFLNLRGLGTTRTLILFDGHRVPDTAQAGGVDVNTIPQFLLERVDVVTGGASAVYGSDAVSGVVNFIVDKRFTGIKAQSEVGISQRGDNGTQKLGVGYGADIGNRGHLLVSYNYVNSEGIDSKTARENGALVPNLTGSGSAANPFIPVLNARLPTANNAGVVISGPLAFTRQFAPGGVIVPFNPGTQVGGLFSGGEGFFFDTGFLASLKSHQGYGRFDYELSDNIDAYVQGTYTRTINDGVFIQQQFTNLTLRTDNPFLSPQAQAALSSTGAATFTIGRVDPEYIRNFARTTSHFINGGLRGDFADGDFNWDVSYTNARTKQRTAARFNINIERQAAALDPVRLGNGQIVCRITTVDPARFPGCVPLNLFGEGSITPEALNYITDETAYDLVQQMDDVSASLTGSLFSIGNAEPIKFALNGEYRKTSLELDSNAQPVPANCTNLPLNCITPATGLPRTLYRSNVVANATGSQEVYEGAAELNAPLLEDQPFAESLSVSGAARYTHYDTSGSVWTWKVGGDWKPFADLRLRATRSRDIRAPNLNELFAPRNASPSGFQDPRTGMNPIVQFVSVGNPDLDPEKADTFTAGIVYQPSFIPRLSIAIDYYDIEIQDAIQLFSGISIAAACNVPPIDADPLCTELIIRPTPTSAPTEVRSFPRNLASFEQSGVDAEINYSFPVGAGDVSLRAITTYVDKQRVKSSATAATIEFAGTIGGGANPPPPTPRWRVAVFTGYSDDNWSLNTLARYRSSLSYNKNPNLFFNVPKVDDVIFVDATLTRKVQAYGGEAEFYISIQNLFDTEAPIFYPNIGAPGFAYPAIAGDDLVGRRFNVGFRGRF